MLTFVTTQGHSYTVAALSGGRFGAALPPACATTYERLFQADYVPRGTYIFTDIERLAVWELRLAAALYRALQGAGMPCLNDPAKVKMRYALLSALHAAGLNPFAAYHADD